MPKPSATFAKSIGVKRRRAGAGATGDALLRLLQEAAAQVLVTYCKRCSDRRRRTEVLLPAIGKCHPSLADEGSLRPERKHVPGPGH
jgi:hypothetical protein